MKNLIKFSKAVSLLSTEKARSLGLSKSMIDRVKKVGLFHAIGKLVPKHNDNMPTYNEISWAIICCDDHFEEDAKNAIYWTEAKLYSKENKYWDTSSSILSNLTDEDFKNIKNLCSELGHEVSINKRLSISIPSFFVDDSRNSSNINSELLLIKGCVISSIRLLEKDEALVDAIDRKLVSLEEINKSYSRKPLKLSDMFAPKGYDVARFNKQKTIIKDVLANKTSVVKAPSGFGKTLLGCMYSLVSNKRVFWVCPRNVVAETVYDNIQRELTNLGVELSIELFLTGEVKKSHGKDSDLAFGADIVVTNIDSILKPSVSELSFHRLYDVLNSNLVFDEFHELVSDAPLYTLFNYMMRARHRLCGDEVSTMLLSATPSCLEVMWDTQGVKTAILPNKEQHYSPVHEVPYKIAISESMPDVIPEGGLTVFNSIDNTQKKYRLADIIVHSKYDEKDRKIVFDELFSLFSKGGRGIREGKTVVSSPIIQASLDISFAHINQSIISPEDTLQRIGRVNRWGEQSIPNACTIALHITKNQSESAAIRTLYNFELRDLWCNFLKEELGAADSIALKDLYEIYNSFVEKYRSNISSFLLSCHGKGASSLLELESYRYSEERKLPTVSVGSSSKNIRSPNGAFYYLVRIKIENGKTKGGYWMTTRPFSCDSHEFTNISSNRKNDRKHSDYVKAFKQVKEDFPSLLSEALRLEKRRKAVDMNVVARLAKRSETPFLDRSQVYHRNGDGDNFKDVGKGIIEIDE